MSDVTGMFEAMAAGASPENDPTTIGNLLQAHCGLTEMQLSEALAMQQGHPTMKLGDAVVACGHATPSQVAQTLDKQRRIRDCKRGSVWEVGKLADWVADKLARRDR
jgi:hypothetical protein